MKPHAALSLLRLVLAEMRRRLLWLLGLAALLMVVAGQVRDTVGMALVLLAFVVVAAVVWEVAEDRGRRAAGKCGCSCRCHVDEGRTAWPGPCAGCCEPGDNCDCGRVLRRVDEPELVTLIRDIKAALPSAALRTPLWLRINSALRLAADADEFAGRRERVP